MNEVSSTQRSRAGTQVTCRSACACEPGAWCLCTCTSDLALPAGEEEGSRLAVLVL